MSYGSKLKELRFRKDFSVEDLEKRTRVSNATIYALEAGERLPTLRTAIRLAVELGATLDEMCELEFAQERETIRETLNGVSRGT